MKNIYPDDTLTESAEPLKTVIEQCVSAAPVFDMHTHLFAPQFGRMNLWGIDELLNYHYLVAEFFRYSNISCEAFWAAGKSKRAELIWQTLFVENTPVSEATRGVVTVLESFGLAPKQKDLREFRKYFLAQSYESVLDNVLRIAGVSDIVMTNDPLDAEEMRVWESGVEIDSRFHASLRLDRFLNDWETAVPLIRAQGFDVTAEMSERTISETRRFLEKWTATMNPVYLGVSLPDNFAYPEESARCILLRDVVLPVCRERNIPLSLMIGVRRKVNPALKLAGDGLGRADVSALTNICAENPDVKILSTFLSRENQHELCVAARKFRNLTPFGCWWFLNNPSMIGEITRERIELLGTSFIPQHSDARILDQLIYKWPVSRKCVAEVLVSSYGALMEAGWNVSREDIERDVQRMFAGNFAALIGRRT